MTLTTIRLCRDDERTEILRIINEAAEAYKGVIPADCWHAPYMLSEELTGEIAAGVVFWGYEERDTLLGVMGIQPVLDVDLIRHAYVRPQAQRRGVGSALLQHLRQLNRRRILSAPGRRPTGRSAFTSGMALCPFRPSAKLRCSRLIGPCPTGRSRLRWCWPTHLSIRAPGILNTRSRRHGRTRRPWPWLNRYFTQAQ